MDQINTGYINSPKVQPQFRVHVTCIYSHARCELSQAIRVSVVVSLVCQTVLISFSSLDSTQALSTPHSVSGNKSSVTD